MKNITTYKKNIHTGTFGPFGTSCPSWNLWSISGPPTIKHRNNTLQPPRAYKSDGGGGGMDPLGGSLGWVAGWIAC